MYALTQPALAFASIARRRQLQSSYAIGKKLILRSTAETLNDQELP
jgi:hypothetical protein